MPIRSRESCASALQAILNKFRQNTISDSGILEMLMNLCNIVYTLNKVKQHNDNDKTRLPIVVNNICLLIHDTFHICVLKNSKAAARLIMCKGSLQTLVAQYCLLWQPPLAAILNAAIDGGDSVSLEIVEQSLSELNAYDVRMLVRQMDALHKEGKPADHILDLMDTLSRYGTMKMIKRYQDFITDESFLFPTLPSYGNHIDEEDVKNISVYFSTKFNKSTDTWEVSLLDAAYELKSGKPSREDFLSYFNSELESLQNLFATYDDNNNNMLDFEESFDLLEELGLGGYAMVEELAVLQNASFQDLVKWWWDKRNIYFSTYSATLNNVTFEDVVDLMTQADATSTVSTSAVPLFNTVSTGSVFSLWGGTKTKTDSQTIAQTTTSPTVPQRVVSFQDIVDNSAHALQTKVSGFQVPVSFEEVLPTEVRKKDVYKQNDLTFMHPSLAPNKITTSIGWTPITELLKLEGADTNWFLRCLQLFCQLCEGKNIRSQVVINKLLPADCLMKILSESQNVRDKGLVCKLLSNVFVYHDFVFPVDSLTSYQATYCSIDEHSNKSKSVIMGKLFNINTSYSKRSDPFILRVKLKEFILLEMDTFTLLHDVEVADDAYGYQYSLMSLIKGIH
jgi:hypothetical protein